MALADPTFIELDGTYPIHFTGQLALDLSCPDNVRAFFTGGPGSGPETPAGFALSACTFDRGAGIVAPDGSVEGLKFSMHDSIGLISGHAASGPLIQIDWSPANPPNWPYYEYAKVALWEDANGNYFDNPNATSGYIVEGSPSPMYLGLVMNYYSRTPTGDGLVSFAPESSTWAFAVIGLAFLALITVRKVLAQTKIVLLWSVPAECGSRNPH